MAHSLPVVALREGTTPAVVVDGTTDVLVEPENRTALAAVLEHLVTKLVLAETMGARGR